MTRLPTPGKDEGTWGDILNAYLAVSHNSDGTLANNTVGTNQIQNSAITNAQLDNSTQTILASVANKYTLPGSGIPNTDMTTAVQTSLGKADSSLQSSQLGAVSGIATLDSGSKLTSGQLPGSVVSEGAPIVASRYLKPSGGDDSAAMIDALTNYAPYAYPVIVLGPGTFLWNTSVPTLARNTPVVIKGSGIDKTTIQLSTAAPSLFRFNKIADHDLFHSIELSDFTVDSNNTGGKNHVIIGTQINGGYYLTRINLRDLTIRRVNTINVPSALSNGDFAGTTTNRWNISFIVQQPGSQETTQNQIQNILVEDCKFYGGNVGICFGGTTTNATKTNVNVFLDNIVYRRCSHYVGKLTPDSVPYAPSTTAFPSINFQIGSYDWGHRATVEECYGEASYTGCGLSNLMSMTVKDTMIVDSTTGNFGINNFSYAGWSDYNTTSSVNSFTSTTEQSAQQYVTFERCYGRRTSGFTGAQPFFVVPNNTVSSPLTGNVIIKDCQVDDLNSLPVNNAWNCGAPIQSLTIDGLTVNKPNVNISNGTATTSLTVLQHTGDVKKKLRLSRISATISGTNLSGNSQNIRFMLFGNAQQGGGSVSQDIEIDGVKLDPTGTDSFTSFGALVGASGAVATITARIHKMKIAGNPSAGNGYGIYLEPTSQLAIGSGGVRIDPDCDLTAVTFPVHVDTTQNGLVLGAQVASPAVPAASATTQNTTGRTVAVVVTGGTGVAVSVDGAGSGQGTGTFMLQPGQTISLGAYSVAPTWKWIGA